MRLNNYSLLQILCEIGLPGPIFSRVKNFMCLGEKLKNSEQCLIFLKKCREQRIFPIFILNSIQLPESLFPLGQNNYSNQILFKLRRQSLNQHIKLKYEMINTLKTDINSLKRSLQSQVETAIWTQLMDLFN